MSESLVCPSCGSDKVTVEYTQKFMVNTDEHYCHSMNTHDRDSPAQCLDCDWKGVREYLIFEDEYSGR